MPNKWDLEGTATRVCSLVVRCKDKGGVDADVVVSSFAGLIAAIKARRDAVTTQSGQRVEFDELIQGLQELFNQGVFNDTVADALLTWAASPFVAGVGTDLLSVCATNLPAGIPNPSRAAGGGTIGIPGSFSYQSVGVAP